jgi:methionyl-tRNA formyltransferase
LKIAYFGLPLGALLLLRDGHTLSPIVLSPIDAPGRRRLRRVEPGLLDAQGVEDQDLKAFDAGVTELLRAERSDLLVSWFWTRKLPRRWLELPPRGAIGVHPSLLPRHRGPNPFYACIDAGDEQTGVTVHRLDEEYDTGRILGALSIPVGMRDAWQLARALDRPSLALLRETVARLARSETVEERAQDERLAT